MNKKKICITAGDFNGIGPEIIVKALNNLDVLPQDVVLIGAKELFHGLKSKYDFIEIPFKKEWLKPKEETKEAGEFSYNCLIKACEAVKNGQASAIVTAPVSKNALHLAGHNFSGQTEVLEKNLSDVSKAEKAEMLFVCNDFRVMLLSRHVALKNIKITKDTLIEKILRINSVLQDKFSISNPKIGLCALNPHAGENGLLGDEEILEFAPAIKYLRENGINISEPKPADTLFVKASHAFLNKQKQPFDVYCACYHDQGLIAIKALAMTRTVNMTVGLNVIRTSPAHGTAYDIAGENIADSTSMEEAIKQALKLSV